MKNIINTKMLGIGLALTMILVVCMQANAQSSNKEQKIIGIWIAVSDNNEELNFKSDGTVTVSGPNRWSNGNTTWHATDTIIAIMKINDNGKINLENGRNGYYEYSFSDDGKTMILIGNSFSFGTSFILKRRK